ncbi:hypothetical protein LLG95_14995 [bacterium]|nr:hypothetical protein [bacterium]
MPEQLEVEVFRAGDYGAKGRWDEAAIDAIAGDYDPSLHEAPVTVDHAQSGPALGWVEALRRVGDRLVARLRITSAKLIEMVRGGAFKKRSVEIYPELRETGRPYLRAVSFLGAAAPEVKGLADPVFSETNEEAPLFAENDPPHEVIEAEIPEAVEEVDREARARKFAELFDRLRNEGRWDPAWNELGMDAFFAELAEPAQEWFGRFVSSLRPIVTMSEAAPKLSKSGEVTLPVGDNVDPDSIELHRSAISFQQEHPGLCYAEALARCAR